MKCTVIGMWGGFPEKDEPTSGYLIEKDGFHILFDTGSGVAAHVQNYVELNDLHHIILSHYHYDHSVDLGAFLFGRMINMFMDRADTQLNIFGPDDQKVVDQVNNVKLSEFHPYDDSSQLNIGPFSIEFHRNTHPVETYAMRITDDEGKVLVYTADSSYMDSLVQFSAGADVLIIECNSYEGEDAQKMGHMNAQEAGLFASRANVNRTVLTHLPHYGDVNELKVSAEKAGAENVELAAVDMNIEV